MPRERQAEITPNYFETLTLAKLYGEFTVPPGTRIMTDIPNSNQAWEEAKKDYEGLCKKYGVSSIGGATIGGKSEFIEISAGMGSPMCSWIPCQPERQLITELSIALVNGKHPLVLDVGCGSGLTSRALAEAADIKVIGIDDGLEALKMTPRTRGNVDLVAADFFDFYEGAMPRRSPQVTGEIKNLIRKINTNLFKDIEDDEKDVDKEERVDPREMYFWARQHNFDIGPRDKFQDEIKRLQQLTKRFEADSPVDVVLCSFMSSGQELTIPIRDGVHPKCIVYVRPANGLAGITDYFTEQAKNMKPGWFENTVMSFHPGDHYRTVARWDTLWEDDWGRISYTGLNPSTRIEKAEVVIQLRKDIKLKRLPDIAVARYQWDDEISEMMRYPQFKWNEETQHYDSKDIFEEEFMQGVQAARKALAD